MKKPNSLNHARVPIYRCTQNKQFNNFLMCPSYIHEKEVLFVYEFAGQHIEKPIPTDALGPAIVRLRKFFAKDAIDLPAEYRGEAYEISPEFVYNYQA